MSGAPDFSFAVEATEPSQLGKDAVRQIAVACEPSMSAAEMTDLLCGMVAAAAGLLAVIHGPELAERMLQMLPGVTRQAGEHVDRNKKMH